MLATTRLNLLVRRSRIATWPLTRSIHRLLLGVFKRQIQYWRVSDSLQKFFLRCSSDLPFPGLGIKDSIPIRIEPGLFEWLGFLHQNFPPYFTPTDLKAQGFNIDTTYKPHLTCDQLREQLNETVPKLYARNNATMEAILKTTTTGNILVVAHAISLETCSRMLLGKTERPWQELYSVFSNCAFCSMAALEKDADGKFSFIEPPAGSITSSSNGSFDWKSIASL